MGRKQAEQIMTDFLYSWRLDQAADYIQRGRRFAGLSDADLVAKWFTVLRAMADAPLDPSCLAETIDVEAELDLRHIEPPYDQVQPELDRWFAATEDLFHAIERDPEMARELRDDIVAQLLAFDDARIWSN